MFWLNIFGLIVAVPPLVFACRRRRWLLFSVWVAISVGNGMGVFDRWPWRADPPTIDCYEGMTLLPHQSCIMRLSLPGTPA